MYPARGPIWFGEPEAIVSAIKTWTPLRLMSVCVCVCVCVCARECVPLFTVLFSCLQYVMLMISELMFITWDQHQRPFYSLDFQTCKLNFLKPAAINHCLLWNVLLFLTFYWFKYRGCHIYCHFLFVLIHCLNGSLFLLLVCDLTKTKSQNSAGFRSKGARV